MHAGKRARTLARSTRLGRRHRAGGVTPVRATPALQSKPVAHASRLVAQVAPSVAFGLGVRIPAAGPAHLRLYSHSGRVRGPQKICSNFSARIGRLPPTARPDSHRPYRPGITEPHHDPSRPHSRIGIIRSLAGIEKPAFRPRANTGGDSPGVDRGRGPRFGDTGLCPFAASLPLSRGECARHRAAPAISQKRPSG
jgi:hypothetical protein